MSTENRPLYQAAHSRTKSYESMLPASLFDQESDLCTSTTPSELIEQTHRWIRELDDSERLWSCYVVDDQPKDEVNVSRSASTRHARSRSRGSQDMRPPLIQHAMHRETLLAETPETSPSSSAGLATPEAGTTAPKPSIGLGLDAFDPAFWDDDAGESTCRLSLVSLASEIGIDAIDRSPLDIPLSTFPVPPKTIPREVSVPSRTDLPEKARASHAFTPVRQRASSLSAGRHSRPVTGPPSLPLPSIPVPDVPVAPVSAPIVPSQSWPARQAAIGSASTDIPTALRRRNSTSANRPAPPGKRVSFACDTPRTAISAQSSISISASMTNSTSAFELEPITAPVTALGREDKKTKAVFPSKKGESVTEWIQYGYAY
jgi:hypothetical protein